MRMPRIKKLKIPFSVLIVFIFLFSIFYFSSIAKAVLVCDDPYSPYYDPNQCGSNIDITCAKYQYPWCQESAKDLGALVGRFYQIALGLAGAAALGVLIYGAILWTVSGAVTSKQDAMEWIWGAVWGLVLLLGAYLILYTINPDLVNLKGAKALFPAISLPSPSSKENVTATPEFKPGVSFDVANSDVKLDTSFVRTMFLGAGIGTKSECLYGRTENCVSLLGLRGATYNEMINLRKDSETYFFITGGTEAGHALGEESHANGYKVDIRTSNDQKDDLSQYILKNFTSSGTIPDSTAQKNGETNAQFQVYKNSKTGAQYVFEKQLKDSKGNIIRYAHWDVAVK